MHTVKINVVVSYVGYYLMCKCNSVQNKNITNNADKYYPNIFIKVVFFSQHVHGRNGDKCSDGFDIRKLLMKYFYISFP